jgi:hypothetical protein
MHKTNSVPGRLTAMRLRSVFMGHDWEFATHRLLLGSTNSSDASAALRFDRGLTYQATFAWRVWSSDDRVSLSIEVPSHRRRSAS